MTKHNNFILSSRFATKKEALSAEFMRINRVLDKLSVTYNLPDHSDFNDQRYPWANEYLSKPAFYAARLWEYPYAILAADCSSKMRCLDVGCGMNPFTIYLQNILDCEIIGLDPDLFERGVKYKCHGISSEFLKRTGLLAVHAGMEQMPFADESFDRVFCISVIEHVDKDIVQKGLYEMARVLKPEGRLIITVDVNLFTELNRPLDLVWESGLLPLGPIDLSWPYNRFGKFCDGLQPADVYGLVLYKHPYLVQTKYTEKKISLEENAWKIPRLREQNSNKKQKKQEVVNNQSQAFTTISTRSSMMNFGIANLLKKFIK